MKGLATLFRHCDRWREWVGSR